MSSNDTLESVRRERDELAVIVEEMRGALGGLVVLAETHPEARLRHIVFDQARAALSLPAPAALSALKARIEAGVAGKYNELLFAVGNKYPNESRHETALRYIRQAESLPSGPAQSDSRANAEGEPQ